MPDYLLFKEDSSTYSFKIQGSLDELNEAFKTLGIEMGKTSMNVFLDPNEENEVFDYFMSVKLSEPSKEDEEFDLMVRRMVFDDCRKDKETGLKWLCQANYINTTAALVYEKKGAQGKYDFIKDLLKRFPE